MQHQHNLRNLRDLLPGIRSRAAKYDRTGDWPRQDLRALSTIGAMRWAAPADVAGGGGGGAGGGGGEDLSAIELHFRYEAIASASLATALILSQRDSAVGLVSAADAWPMRRNMLERLCNDEIFATIGIAQLTTSRQGGPAALRATETSDGYELDGVIPWSSGAAHSAYVIAGAALVDGDDGGGGGGGEQSQILFALPTDLPGVRIAPPAELVALRSSWTAQVRCERAALPRHLVLRGPEPRVLSVRRKTLPLGQTFLAMGLCQGGLDLIAEHRSGSARAAHERLAGQLRALRDEILQLSAPAGGREADAAAAAALQAPRLRGRCNDLALRITHAAVTLYKGSALLLDHPAQRLAREAMFLLVWSCPNPVIDCTVELLSQ